VSNNSVQNYSGTKHVSLSDLERHSTTYETLPQPMSRMLVACVAQTILFSVLGLLALHLAQAMNFEGKYWLLGDIRNGFLAFVKSYAPLFILINWGCLAIGIFIFLISLGFTRSVHEPLHWLATANAAPVALSAGLNGVLVPQPEGSSG
jgi:hypothetical protein